jgi:hypothetical protein
MEAAVYPSTPLVSYWAAVASTVFGLGYVAALLATLTGAIAEGPWATACQLAPSIVLAWSYLILMACVLDVAAPERRVWATVAFGFALMYSVMNSIVYFAVLCVVIPKVLRNQGESVSVLLFEPGKFLFAVNGLAYGFMSTSALFAAPVFARHGTEARVRRALLAHGAIGPFVVGAVAWPPLTMIGALWIVTFPTMGVLLAIEFRAAKVKAE